MTDVAVSPHDSRRLLLAGDMLGVGLSLDRGDSWLPTFGFKSYEIARFTWHPTDPQTVWVGTMSGPYLSRDGGLNWTEKREGMGEKEWGRYSAPVEKVLFDPNDQKHLIAIGGSSRGWRAHVKNSANWGRIWESRDGGDSWKMLTLLQTDGTMTQDPKIVGDNILWAQFAGQSSSKLYAIGQHTRLHRFDRWRGNVDAKQRRFAAAEFRGRRHLSQPHPSRRRSSPKPRFVVGRRQQLCAARPNQARAGRRL